MGHLSRLITTQKIEACYLLYAQWLYLVNGLSLCMSCSWFVKRKQPAAELMLCSEHTGTLAVAAVVSPGSLLRADWPVRCHCAALLVLQPVCPTLG